MRPSEKSLLQALSQIAMDFMPLLHKSVAGTINGILGSMPTISLVKYGKISEFAPPCPLILTTIYYTDADRASGNSYTLGVLNPVRTAMTLADLVLGGDGTDASDNAQHLNDDHLEIIKEMVTSAVEPTLAAMHEQSNMPKLKCTDIKTEVIDTLSPLSNFALAYELSISLNELNSPFLLLVSKEMSSLFVAPDVSHTDSHYVDATQLNEDEIRNIGMLLDVKLNLKVRIGQKRMLLKDVIAMDIGSVVELNQLANDPLEVIIDDKVIAKGELVIVDGNFGIQITGIGTKRERLEQLRGL